MDTLENQSIEGSLNEADFNFIAQFMYNNTGIVLKQEKRIMVQSRLFKRMQALQLQNMQDYCKLISSPRGQAELTHLVNALTTNLTNFFRESHHFDHLKNVVIKEKCEEAKNLKGGKLRFRLWSAGCSSGEEIYSAAMTIKESNAPTHTWDFKMLATDLDTNMVNTARQGHYTNNKGIPQAYLSKYCTINNGKTAVNPEIKNLITFNALNLMNEWPMKGMFDVIFCRNTIIYFDKETQKRLFDRFANIMPMGAWLYIGYSENISQITDRFELIGRTIYRKVQ